MTQVIWHTCAAGDFPTDNSAMFLVYGGDADIVTLAYYYKGQWDSVWEHDGLVDSLFGITHWASTKGWWPEPPKTVP